MLYENEFCSMFHKSWSDKRLNNLMELSKQSLNEIESQNPSIKADYKIQYLGAPLRGNRVMKFAPLRLLRVPFHDGR